MMVVHAEREYGTYVELVDGDADSSLCSATSQANEVQAADVTGEQRGAKLQPTSGVRRCMLITMHVHCTCIRA